MTESITCDQCGTAVPEDEWQRHANATVEFKYLKEGMGSEIERGPRIAHLCGECTMQLAETVSTPIPADWKQWPEDNEDDGQ